MKPMMFKYPVVVGDAPAAVGKMTIEPAKRLEIWIGKSRDTRAELDWALRRHPKDVRIRIPRKSAFATSTALFAIQHEDLVREQIAKGAIVVATHAESPPTCTLALSDLAPVCALDLYPSDAYGLLARHGPLRHEVVRVCRNPVTAELYTTAERFPAVPRTVKSEPILVPLRVWSTTAGVGNFCQRLPPLTLGEEDAVARNWSKYNQSAPFLLEGRRPVAYLDTTTTPHAIERACALAEYGVLCVRGDLPLNLKQLGLIERRTRNSFLFFDSSPPEQTKKALRLRRWRAS